MEPVQASSSRAGEQRRSPYPLLAAGGAAVLAILSAGNLTEWGRFATAYVFVALNYYIGVVTLVALTLTVMAGLVSTDRILLRIGHRVLFQGVHRATSILAVIALGIHIAVKVLSAHAAVGDAVVPFFSQGRSLFIGFGTIAGYLMLMSFWAGLARTRFIGSVRPWLWRVLHCSAYLCWLTALAHGLNAGRPAATWVTVSYLACVVGVTLALLARLYTRFGRYAPGTKTERAVGVNGQTAFMPRYQDTRVPLSAPRSPVDMPIYPSSPSIPDSERYDYAPVSPPSYADEPSYYQDDPSYYQDAAYPDGAYQTDTYADPYHHDYWAEGDRSQEPPIGPWAPQPQRPQLRLITNDDVPADVRHSRTQPRGRRGGNAEDYRAG